jgi:hypothetical protein
MLIDVSHVVEDGMITYRGLPAPVICDFLSRERSRSLYAEGTEFQIGKIEMIASTGTYLDSPFHRFAHGQDLSQLSSNAWPTWKASSYESIVPKIGRSGGPISRGMICAARPCWSTRGGTPNAV